MLGVGKSSRVRKGFLLENSEPLLSLTAYQNPGATISRVIAFGGEVAPSKWHGGGCENQSPYLTVLHPPDHVNVSPEALEREHIH